MAKQPMMLEMEVLEEVAPTLRTLAHPLRLRILDFLQYGERTVMEVARAIEKSQALTSHHLAIMRNNGVISARREGSNIFYSVKLRAALGLLDCIRRAKACE